MDDHVPIEQVQIGDRMLSLQRAAAVLHRDAQRVAAAQLSVSVVLALLGLTATSVSWLQPAVAIGGLTWTLAGTIWAAPLMRRLTRRAATAQEMFDRQLFGLPWNQGLVGNPIPPEEILAFAARLRSGDRLDRGILAGWYDATAGLSYPIDVLVCQEQSVAWDGRLRQRMTLTLKLFAGVWIIAGCVAGIATHQTLLQTLINWYVPSLPLLAQTFQLSATQTAVSEERRRLREFIGNLLERAMTDSAATDWLVPHASSVQDGIFASRSVGGRAPALLYFIMRRRDDSHFEQVTAARRRQFGVV
jgi:hypothetical protein